MANYALAVDDLYRTDVSWATTAGRLFRVGPSRDMRRHQTVTGEFARSMPDDAVADLEISIQAGRETPKWLSAAAAKLAKLLQLEEGWDSYEANKINVQTVMSVMNLLVFTMVDDRLPIPSLVPTVDGNIQIEWHTATKDIEVHVSPHEAILRYEDLIDEANSFEFVGQGFEVAPRLQQLLSGI